MSDFPPKTPGLHEQQIETLRGTFRWIGWALIIIGVLAIMFPLVGSIAAKVMLGLVFMVSGALVLYHAFQAREWGAALWSGLVGVLNLAVGAYLTFLPLSGLVGLTVLMGISFLLQGAFEAAIAARQRPRKGWGWLLVSGAASAVLGVLLIAGLPGTALWALGLMLGVNLLTSGISLLALSKHGADLKP